MRLSILGLFVVVMLSVISLQTVRAQADLQTEENNKPELIAIKFHADWCGSCRRMGSVFEDLATVTEDEPVLFVRLDLTDSSSRKQAQYLMSMLNLGKTWADSGAGEKTGFILLVDAANHEVLGKLTADQDLKQMKAALTDAVVRSRG